MNPSRTARDRARIELTRKIKDEARRQLATGGAAAISLRAVTRSLDVVSSAIYRYFPSRDDLLTALIIDAYDAMGEAAERADTDKDPRARWQAVCRAIRAWALENRHEYALIYGSPVPGYEAPADTVAPAVRVPLLLTSIAKAAKVQDGTLGHGLRSQLENVVASTSIELPPGALARVIVAWTQLFGMISFELFGQLVGSVDPADDFFDFSTAALADYVGL
jgi:AcrR family transcriptional regulator